ncbi:MAG TPA: hypothetical protein VMM18_13755 [Gemmatimonadaceae bacterium]|nr:hypothetical protein [Gemmatimonadaceae bacterium]
MQGSRFAAGLRRAAAVTALAAATLGGAAACTNPVSGGHDARRTGGVAIYLGGTEVARSQGTTVTGALPTVAVGEQSELLTIVFVDGGGDPLDFSGSSDLYVRARSADPGIAGFEVTGYDGRVVGEGEGATTIQFDLMHGTPPSGGHADFTSRPIPVEVQGAVQGVQGGQSR